MNFVYELKYVAILEDTPKLYDPVAWAWRVVKNETTDRQRRHALPQHPFNFSDRTAVYGKDETISEIVNIIGNGELTPEEHIILKEDMAILLSRVTSLPRSQREVVILRLIEGLSNSEAAAYNGNSTDSVKENYYRGIRRLHAEYAEKDIPE